MQDKQTERPTEPVPKNWKPMFILMGFLLFVTIAIAGAAALIDISYNGL